MLRASLAFALVAGASCCFAAEGYTFDSAQFEKKPIELGGYLELKFDHFELNRGSTFYDLNFVAKDQRATLDRRTATLKLTGKARAGDWLVTARTNSEAVQDQLSHSHGSRFDELIASWKPIEGFALEGGKIVTKWGKGYAWNPVAFVERPKDPNDPELVREGFKIVSAEMLRTFEGPLQTVAFTPLLLPVTSGTNSDYGQPDHLNVAARLYLLYRDTDIDFYYLNRGSRSPRIGADFSRNLGSNLEVHGEWARIDGQDFSIADPAGNIGRRTEMVTSWLLGMRHLNANDITTILEYYRNGTGFSQSEYRNFLTVANSALEAGAQGTLFQRVQALTPQYARQTPLRDYLYLRVSVKEPFDILYFTPSITAIVNVGDGSYSVTPEVLYTGKNNIELRARAVFLGGGDDSDFGERQTRRRIELYARFYF